MRPRLNQLAFSLLCAFMPFTSSNADSLELRMDKTFSVMPKPSQKTPTFLEADQLTSLNNNQIEATGNAILRLQDQSIRADRLLYFKDSDEVEALGSVSLSQNNSLMTGPHLKLNLDTNIGLMEQPSYYLAENGARGDADVMHIEDKLHYTLDNANYTTCPVDNQDWLLNMRSLEIDREQQLGIARHAWVEFKGVPILYTPWMDFPLNSNRKSGLLAPVMGNTTKGGREISLPYYWNIATNLDATLTPRIMTKRGVLLGNEFRYLEPSFGGELQLDVLPNDALANRTRSHLSLLHRHTLAPGLSSFANLNRASDDAYFRDLGSAVSATSQVFLLQDMGLNYSSDKWNVMARVQRYQSLQDPAAPIVAPYKRLPQLTLNAHNSIYGANFSFMGEFDDFSHPTLINAKRLVLNPSLSYPLITAPAFYLTPKLSLHATSYTMGANNTAAWPNATRILPIVSVDSGISLERDWNLLGRDFIHTLEPRAFYVFVPYSNQNLLPNFDSAQATFDFTQMFTENRFFGNDRVGDANHITLAVTSRLLEQDSGIERLKLMLGQRLSFKTPKVNLVTPASTTNKSDILLGASGKITNNWSLDSEFQYDPNNSRSQRYNITSRYRPEMGKAFDLGYRYDRNTLRSIDMSGQWPIYKRWNAVGRLNYSIKDSKTLESLAGLEYNQNCWTLRLVLQRFTVGTLQANTGIFLQLELNDFVSVGIDPVKTLKQSVPSYTKLNEKPANQPDSALR